MAMIAEQQDVIPRPFARARAHSAALESKLGGLEMTRAPHTEIEALVDAQGREWARLMLDEHMALRAAAERRVEVRGAEGVDRSSARDSARQLETLVGRVDVPRLAYQTPGTEDLHPLDASLKLPRELFSHGIRRMVAKEVARASFDEVVEIVHDYSGSQIAKRQVEELAVRAAQDFDAFYEQRAPEHAPKAELLVLSTDGKGIVMRHEDLRAATRAAAAKKSRKVETRLTPGEKSNRKRMAQVATVYSVAPWVRSAGDILHGLRDPKVEEKRPKPHDKRVWASVEKTPRATIREMFDEALGRDPQKERRWVVLVDGEPKQLRAVKAEARRVGVEITLILDIVHVLEYLWKAARVLFDATSPKAESWVGDRLLALLSGKSGGDVARTIRWWVSRKKPALDTAGKAMIETVTGYLADRSRTRMMRYAEALHAGLPIATGVIEGACRYLVKDRMDRTGARWSLTGAEAILRLRAIRSSGDFDAYWEFHLARDYERNHLSRYADATPPDPMPAPKPRLKRVK